MLKDMCHAIVEEELAPNFERICNDVIEARNKRCANPNKFAPSYYNVLPKPKSSSGSKSTSKPSTPTLGIFGEERPKKLKRRRVSSWAMGFIRKPKKKKVLKVGINIIKLKPASLLY